MTDDTITVQTYLVIAGKRTYYSKVLASGKVSRATVGKPGVLHRDEIAVKVRLEIPKGCFEPLNLTDAGLVEVPSSRILSPAFFVEEVEGVVDEEDEATP